MCLCGKMCFSQTTLLSNTKYQLETGTYLSTSGITPFWLRSNQYGIVPLQAPILTFRGSAHKEYDSTKNENQKLKKFGYGYGFWGVANVGKQSAFLLPEAYLKVRYGAFEFYGGRRREMMGLVDTTLSSGSYIWSGNALPMPKLQISIPNYTSIIGHGLVSIKGSFAHGWFGQQAYVKNYYLHQKSLHGKLGKDHWAVNLFGGINHLVQWGGKPYGYTTNQVLKNGGFPSSIYAFLYSIYPSKKLIQSPNLSKYFTQFDTDNRVGNQVGSIDFALTLKFKNTQMLFYRQLPLEVGQLRYLTNADDGLYGISTNLKNKSKVKHIVIEYLFTHNQGTYLPFLSRTFNLSDRHPGEAERYFNHDQYWAGWTYNLNTIGTPFIMNDKFIIKEYRSNIPAFISTNNRIKMLYLGFSGEIGKLSYVVKSSFSKNYGEPRFVYNEYVKFNAFDILIIHRFERQNIHASINLSSNSKGLLESSTALKCSIVKNW